MSTGTHHDNFFLWDSKIHRWNAVRMGPQMDIVGLWQQAAKKEGLRFGVSEHLGASYTCFRTSHGAHKDGPMKGFDSIKELVDTYQPDLLYSDSRLPFEDVGRSLVAHFYN